MYDYLTIRIEGACRLYAMLSRLLRDNPDISREALVQQLEARYFDLDDPLYVDPDDDEPICATREGAPCCRYGVRLVAGPDGRFAMPTEIDIALNPNPSADDPVPDYDMQPLRVLAHDPVASTTTATWLSPDQVFTVTSPQP